MYQLKEEIFDALAKTVHTADAIHIPDAIHVRNKGAVANGPRRFIAEGLLNPRGICLLDDGRLLVAEAGSGHADGPFSGRISQLRPDPAAPGNYLPPEVIASGFRSINMQNQMRRDEIMGVSDVALGGGCCVVSQTDYVGGSRLLCMQGISPEPMFHSQGNLNALCWHPELNSWLAVKPDQDVLVEFSREHGEQILATIPKYPAGQDAVPVSLEYESATGAVLVSLFSGELHQHPLLKGVDFEDNAGRIIRVWPDTGEIETVVTGLQFPTGLALRANHQLLVLELCDGVLEPLSENWNGEARHGGYARYSGRLLNIDLRGGGITVLAEQLDTPSNLCLLPDDKVLISEGMGLTGRPLPTPMGKTENLVGRIRLVDLKN